MMMDSLFLQVLNMSLTGSAVILVVLVARLLLRRAPKVYSYALWSVVLFRLVCPFSFESVFSLIPVKANPIPADIGFAANPQVNLGIAAVDRTVNAILPPANPVASVNPLQIWIEIGRSLWIIGVLLLLIGAIVSLIRLQRRLHGAVMGEAGIFYLPGLETPFVLGVVRPRIYLPTGLSPQEKEYILLHERSHIRRGDHIIKLLAFLVLCVHWFNPLVWLAFALSVRDMEMSCDEQVVGMLGSGVKKQYSGSLLSLATGRHFFGGSPLAFGEGNTGARIKNILNYRKPTFWVTLVVAVVVIALCIGLMANPKDQGSAAAPLDGILISQSDVALQDGTQATLQLLLPAGQVIADGEYPPGGGFGEGDHHQGSGELRLLVGDAVRSSLAMDEEGSLVFQDTPITIGFGDYNEDGNPDFSIGQWGSSSVNLFSLFTIDGQGELRRISQPLSIVSVEGKGDQAYSMVFAAENGVINSHYYDNAIGEEQAVNYEWVTTLGQFVEQTPLAAENRFMAELLASCSVEDGVAQLTVPEEIPTTYRLDLAVSGLIPDGEASHKRVDAFERETAESLWEPGKTYRQQMSDAPLPDGSEVSFKVAFFDEDSIQVCWDYLPFEVNDGVAKPEELPFDTTVTIGTDEAGAVLLRYIGTQETDFTAKFWLPDGWRVDVTQPESLYQSVLPAGLSLYDGDTCVGSVGYNNFDYIPSARGENFRVSVYNSIMLGSVVSWDDSYTPVKTSEMAETASCRVRYQQGGAGGTTSYNDGLLSYDINLLKYIAIELEEGAASPSQLKQIAESIVLS